MSHLCLLVLRHSVTGTPYLSIYLRRFLRFSDVSQGQEFIFFKPDACQWMELQLCIIKELPTDELAFLGETLGEGGCHVAITVCEAFHF